MDTPTPLGRYLGCEHIPRDCKLAKHDHPFAHVFDKSIPDPAAKPASAAPTQDYTEIFPEEGVLVRHHLQPRKATYRPSKEESALMQLGQIRCTEINPLSGSDNSEKWDSTCSSGKHGELWTGRTYLVTDDLDKASAVAAVAKVKNRNKLDAKKQARAQTFYDVNQLSDNKGCMYNKAREVVYDMSSFLQQAVDRYKSLVPQEFRDLKKVSTPFAEDKIARPTSVESEPLGKLAPIASKVLMKLLFAARMARYDLLRAVQGLASRVTKWSPDCDKALHRLMCYVQSTLDMKMSGYIGDSIHACKLWLFADSDHAGEHDSKSTSGSLLCLVGPNTYFPLAAFSKKQTSIALSSTEAEVVCANVSLRALGLPASAIWGILQQAGGDKAQSQTDINHQKKLNSASKTLKLPKHPDEWLDAIKHEGHSSLIDGRIVELYSNGKDIKPPIERETHPLRDAWVVRKGKWHHHQEAVSWEDLANRTYIADQCDEAIMLVYRRSGSEYRRHAKAEADLHMEILGIRDSGGYRFERRDPIAKPDDYGLIVAAPHSIQPVVLEDNQATIRILESGKSPAFRHADKPKGSTSVGFPNNSEESIMFLHM